MNREFQIRFTAGLLILLTTAAVVLAWINFQKNGTFYSWDGVCWMEQAENAAWLPTGSRPTVPAIRPASAWATALSRSTTRRKILPPACGRLPGWRMVESNLFGHPPVGAGRHDGDPGPGGAFNELLASLHCPDLSGIGLMFCCAADSAEFNGFCILCLVSFIFYAFKFSGKLNDFDWTI